MSKTTWALDSRLYENPFGFLYEAVYALLGVIQCLRQRILHRLFQRVFDRIGDESLPPYCLVERLQLAKYRNFDLSNGLRSRSRRAWRSQRGEKLLPHSLEHTLGPVALAPL